MSRVMSADLSRPEYAAYLAANPGPKETLSWKIWDTQTFVSGTTVQLTQWFNTRATRDLSNMAIPYQFGSPNGFWIRAPRFFVKQRPGSVDQSATTVVQTGRLDNIAQLINTGVFTFSIGQKVYMEEPLWALTAGAGAHGAFAMQGAEAVGVVSDYGQNGIAAPGAINTIEPIFIGPGSTFTATLVWPATITLAGGDTPLCLALDGSLVRPQ